MNETILKKFIGKTNLKSADDCWLWGGYKFPNGYGAFRIWNKNWLAHRFSWSFFNGPIPLGLYICHHCDVRLCVNPNHLFLGTATENMQDLIKKGKHPTSKSLTHCPKGHKYTAENSYFFASDNNLRRCKECRCQSQVAQRRKRLEAN